MRYFRFHLLFWSCITVCLAETAPLRLPSGIKPVHYQATLDITPGADTFSGHIQISLELSQATAEISLHAKALKIQSIQPPPKAIQQRDNDIVTFVYNQPFPVGRHQLDIAYTGTLSRLLTDGAFQQQHAGEWYVFTKFEPITARRVFPCFDEPGFKVPWQLSLRVPSELKAFSNTAIESEDTPANGFKLVHFRQTQPLPSYLVAFAVGPFDVVATAPVGRKHVPSRIIVPKGRAEEASYAASITPQLIHSLEDYFGIPYPYDKLDQVVVPLTTSWGAMENAGLIAYGDFFLAPASQDSEFRHQQLAIGMAHEMSHQWFGDLVTMEWWNDLWLNEAFASWLSNKLVNQWNPAWQIAERNAASISVFRADSLTSARTIRQPIANAGDIASAFDGITYGKGQAVIGMMEHYLGSDVFARGVRQYLEAHANGNATSGDLLSKLDAAAPSSGVGAAFDSFLNQTGFPLIHVEVVCKPIAHVSLTQRRLLPVGSSGSTAAFWHVPVCLAWENGSRCVLFAKSAQDFELNTQTCPESVFADADGAGYYAPLYSRWDNPANASPAGKAAYLANIRLLFASGLGDLTQELQTGANFGASQDAILVEGSVNMLRDIDDLVSSGLRTAYVERIKHLYGARATELGWRPKSNDSLAVRALRRDLLPFAATTGGSSALLEEARRLAENWLTDRNSLESEMVPGVLFAAAWNGDRKLFAQMAAALRSTSIRRERAWIISGFSGFRQKTIVEAALQLIGAEGLDPRETSALLFSANIETRENVWQYVQSNFDTLNKLLPSARGVPFAARLPAAAGGFCDAAHASAAASFFTARLKDLPAGPRNLANVLEQISLCAAQAQAAQPAIAAFLRP